jgi:hypothetical protein
LAQAFKSEAAEATRRADAAEERAEAEIATARAESRTAIERARTEAVEAVRRATGSGSSPGGGGPPGDDTAELRNEIDRLRSELDDATSRLKDAYAQIDSANGLVASANGNGGSTSDAAAERIGHGVAPASDDGSVDHGDDAPVGEGELAAKSLRARLTESAARKKGGKWGSGSRVGS